MLSEVLNFASYKLNIAARVCKKSLLSDTRLSIRYSVLLCIQLLWQGFELEENWDVCSISLSHVGSQQTEPIKPPEPI